MRPYYESGGITIYHGDCREVLLQLGRDKAVVSDPPYGVAFDTDYRRFTTGFDVERTNHPAVHGDSDPFDPAPWLGWPEVILWGANCYSDRLPMGSWLVWDKRHKNGTAFLADAEVAWEKGGHGVYIFAVRSQGFMRSEPIQHPTQKPESLMEWCIKRTTLDVLDPFMGSGSTLVGAKNIGRKAIGIEIEERYCEIAAERLSQEVLDFGTPPEGATHE